jgi:bifunctional DNase/RNase
MSWINRTMIVPAEHVDLARALAEGISGPAGAGMWTTGLSADGTEPATHYISAGLIEDTFAAPLPLTTYTTDQDGNESSDTAPGNAAFIADKAEAPLAVIESLLDAVTVTDEPAAVTMARMGLVIVDPEVTDGSN